jgi:large subunit ribosomal protein L3
MANQTMGLIGRKIGMTQLFRETGEVVPVTVIEAGPCTITQVKTDSSRDHYNAVQLAYGERKANKTTKPELGHFRKAGLENGRRCVREFRVPFGTAQQYEVGRSSPRRTSSTRASAWTCAGPRRAAASRAS